MRNYQNQGIGCLAVLLILFLPPLAVIRKGIIPILVVTISTIVFWPLGSILAAIYLGD
jgi:hypothetical protein